MSIISVLDGDEVRDATQEELSEISSLQAAALASALSNAQAAQMNILTAAYNTAIAQPISYTSKSGITTGYQCDPLSVSNVVSTMLGYEAAQATPTGFYWVAADNSQVPFTYQDLQALAAVMMAQGWVAFQHLQARKNAVRTAATVQQVQSITW